MRKTRYLIESSQKYIIIYIDHDLTFDITKQISMIIIFTNKLNLKLVRVSNYIQKFELKFRHKLSKQHIMLDALSRFPNNNTRIFSQKEELDALFTTSLMKIKKFFWKKILDEYKFDFNWKKNFSSSRQGSFLQR